MDPERASLLALREHGGASVCYVRMVEGQVCALLGNMEGQLSALWGSWKGKCALFWGIERANV